MSLTNKQRVFVEEYLRTWNATAAARAAGYRDNHLHTNASKLLQNTTIKTEIQRRLSETHMSADEVLLRTAEIARGDLTEWMNADGHLDLKALKDSGKGHLVRRYRVTRRTHTTRSGDETETTTAEIELYPADAAHDRLMRVHGLYNDRVRVMTWQDEVIDLLRRRAIDPADVRAAYPDLAGDFFARAGLTQEADASGDG